MNTAVTPYDRLLISLAVAALGAVALTGRARAEDAGPQIDRYGGEATRLQAAPDLARPSVQAPVAIPVSAAAAGLRGPLALNAPRPFAGPRPLAGRALSWAGKSEPVAPVAGPSPAPEHVAYAPAPVMLQPAPPIPAAPVFQAARTAELQPAPPLPAAPVLKASRKLAAQPARPLPASIYAPAPVAPAPSATAAPYRAPVIAPAPRPVIAAAVPAPRVPSPAPAVAKQAASAKPTPSPAAPAAAAPAPPAQVAVAAPPPRAAQAYNGGGVRHYSVHREFGMAPDPTPIPPQFFTATADLSAGDAGAAEPLPRTPPTQTGTGKSGRARTAVAANPT